MLEASNTPKIMYHVSRSKNRKGILARGLEPRTQEFTNVKRKPGVYLFANIEDAVDWAFWFAFDIHEAVDIFEVRLPEGYNLEPETHPEMTEIYDAWIGYDPIPAQSLTIKKVQEPAKSSFEAPPFVKRNKQ